MSSHLGNGRQVEVNGSSINQKNCVLLADVWMSFLTTIPYLATALTQI